MKLDEIGGHPTDKFTVRILFPAVPEMCCSMLLARFLEFCESLAAK